MFLAILPPSLLSNSPLHQMRISSYFLVSIGSHCIILLLLGKVFKERLFEISIFLTDGAKDRIVTSFLPDLFPSAA